MSMLNFLHTADVIIRPAEVYPSPEYIPEARWTVFDVTLPLKPTNSVLIIFYPADTTFIDVFPMFMVFEPENWNVSQVLVVTATDDNVNREDVYEANLGVDVHSLDPKFHNATVPEFILYIEDNDEGTNIRIYVHTLLIARSRAKAMMVK